MNKTLKRKDYWKIFLLFGIVYIVISIINIRKVLKNNKKTDNKKDE